MYIPRANTARYSDQNFLPKTALPLFRFAILEYKNIDRKIPRPRKAY
jgi:hypothetical protein